MWAIIGIGFMCRIITEGPPPLVSPPLPPPLSSLPSSVHVTDPSIDQALTVFPYLLIEFEPGSYASSKYGAATHFTLINGDAMENDMI